MDFHIHNVEQLNNINQAHFHQAEKAIDKNSPHIVICPQCGGASYRFNEYCYNGKCTFGIKQYFDYQEWYEKEQHRKALLQKKSQRLGIFTLVAFLTSLFGLYLGSLHPVGYLVFFVAGYLALVFNNSGQQVGKEITKIETEE